MAKIRLIEPVARMVSIIASDPAFIEYAYDLLQNRWGKIAERSAPMPFVAGGYYSQSMGDELLKTVIAFEPFERPDDLATWKIQTNQWETECARALNSKIPRPVNLDVGYLTQAKWILATMKNRDHRIYLRDGVFAEVTLRYTRGDWHPNSWSYESYRQGAAIDFAHLVRRRLRQYLLQTGQMRKPD